MHFLTQSVWTIQQDDPERTRRLTSIYHQQTILTTGDINSVNGRLIKEIESTVRKGLTISRLNAWLSSKETVQNMSYILRMTRSSRHRNATIPVVQ